SQAATSLPLPTILGGARVSVRDSFGSERFAPLFYVSPTQINYQIPPGTGTGDVTVTVFSGDGSVSVSALPVVAVSPGLFAANADGQGVAAAQVLRVKADGSQSFESVSQFDAALKKYVARPIDLGSEGEQVYLVLYGTGIRGRSSLGAVALQVGGM